MNKNHLPGKPVSASIWHQHTSTMHHQVQAWWRDLSNQERKLLRLCLVVIVAAAVWWVALQPALNSIAQSRQRIPMLREDVAQVQAYILEAQALQQQRSGRVDSASILQFLHSSLKRAGLQDAVDISQSSVSDTPLAQWEIHAHNASAALFMAWLAELPYLLHLQIVQVELARGNDQGRDRPGQVSGRVLLRQHGKEQP